MNRDITAESVCDMMVEAVTHVHRDDLAYLFATGKNELYLRDHLAAYMHRTLGLSEEQFVGREWKKHDLTINNGEHPYAIIEGKSYIHYDAANPMHLEKGKNTIKHDLERDLGKTTSTLRRALTRGYDCKRIFTAIMFTVEVTKDHDKDLGNITYAQYHRQGGNKFGSYPVLIQQGRTNLRELMSRYGTVSSVPLNTGKYKGMQVTADFFAVENIGDR
jgi:hypothetical protein